MQTNRGRKYFAFQESPVPIIPHFSWVFASDLRHDEVSYINLITSLSLGSHWCVGKV